VSKATVELLPFGFANFLRVKEWADHTFPVAHLSDEQAAAYWDELKPLWLAHVQNRRQMMEIELAQLVKKVSP